MIIAVAGKGGTGKTTIASLLVRAIAKNSDSILAVDADPNSNFGMYLGADGAGTVMDIVENMSKNKESAPAGMTKDRYISMKVQEALCEGDRFDLLSLGRPEGPGCYCYANNLLRDLSERLIKSYDYTIVDNEAGMEHLSRRLLSKISHLIVVSDNTIVGVRSAGNIYKLIKDIGICHENLHFVINKSGDTSKMKNEILKTGFKDYYEIPSDPAIEKISLEGGDIFRLPDDSPALKAVGLFVNNKLNEPVRC